MNLRQQMRDRFFHAMLDAIMPHNLGPDPEVTLEALLEATELLQEHFEQELAEMRVEQAE
jgi:MarR-like DNA-binding transcriptional regulator SgrR of sgrS sRNA